MTAAPGGLRVPGGRSGGGTIAATAAAATMRTVLFGDPPAFCATVVRLVAPALRQRPLVVPPPGAERATVLALSPEAEAAGIRKGTAVRLARKLGLPVYVGREDIRAFAAKRGQNIEEAGRERRYMFLRDTARRVGARRIATGHTLTDQAETVFMRILRGTGLTGLAGIAPLVDGLIIRPLIEVERSEVEAYLRVRKIPHREDESNRDLRCLRNRVRRRLMACMVKCLNAGKTV